MLLIKNKKEKGENEDNTGDADVGSTPVAEQILTGTDGDIHYSYYLPKDFDESKNIP